MSHIEQLLFSQSTPGSTFNERGIDVNESFDDAWKELIKTEQIYLQQLEFVHRFVDCIYSSCLQTRILHNTASKLLATLKSNSHNFKVISIGIAINWSWKYFKQLAAAS